MRGFGCRHDRIETTAGEITDQTTPTRHGAHTFSGPVTRTASTLAAHTLSRIMPEIA